MNTKQLGLVLGVIGLISLVVFGYIVLKNSPKADSLSEESNFVSNETSSTQSPIKDEPAQIDETAKWKTYKNDEYDYEIKYPNNWQVEVGTDFSFASFISPNGISPNDAFTIITGCVGGWDYYGEEGELISKTEKFTLGNRVYTSSKSYTANGKFYVHTIETDFPNNYAHYSDYCKTASFSVGKNISDDLVKQILSTFNFTK